MSRPTPEPPILTRVESELMRVLWERQEATVHEVVAALPRAMAYTSALTVLRILEKKGYVAHQAHPDGGRAHVYRPLVPATHARRQHVRDLVDRLFSGQSSQLVVGLLEDEALSAAELERMRALIDSRLATVPEVEASRPEAPPSVRDAGAAEPAKPGAAGKKGKKRNARG